MSAARRTTVAGSRRRRSKRSILHLLCLSGLLLCLWPGLSLAEQQRTGEESRLLRSARWITSVALLSVTTPYRPGRAAGVWSTLPGRSRHAGAQACPSLWPAQLRVGALPNALRGARRGLSQRDPLFLTGTGVHPRSTLTQRGERTMTTTLRQGEFPALRSCAYHPIFGNQRSYPCPCPPIISSSAEEVPGARRADRP